MKIIHIVALCLVALPAFASGSGERETIERKARFWIEDESERAEAQLLLEGRFVDEDEAFPITLDADEWMSVLGAERYRILRKKGTERAFTGDLLKVKERGTYYSAASGQPLFSSEEKYDSGTGWPSFWAPVERDAIVYAVDRSLFTTRVEIMDSESGSHLGHVFFDGPAPTGLRYCVNSLSLIFVPEGGELPEQVQELRAQGKNSQEM